MNEFDTSLRLPEDGYYPARSPKNLIVLHHTVGGSARSTFEYWRTDPRRIGTAYIVERDGKVHKVFPPECWAYHLGLKRASAVDKRSIGIEIASEGALLERGGKYYAFGRLTEQTLFAGPVFDHGADYRGFRYFARYTTAALTAVFALVEHLLTVYSIPRRTSEDHIGAAPEAYRRFSGVLAHCHLRADKTDVHPGFPWEDLAQHCRLEMISQ